jgi:hypothetical protein
MTRAQQAKPPGLWFGPLEGGKLPTEVYPMLLRRTATGDPNTRRRE